jgi:prefoldin subunit 5
MNEDMVFRREVAKEVQKVIDILEEEVNKVDETNKNLMKAIYKLEDITSELKKRG